MNGEGKPVSKKGNVVKRSDFERLKDEYYALRGWDPASGLLTRQGLKDLELDELADDLADRGGLA
jgi:aldehyde:ferredoxin oxidoreductase